MNPNQESTLTHMWNFSFSNNDDNVPNIVSFGTKCNSEENAIVVFANKEVKVPMFLANYANLCFSGATMCSAIGGVAGAIAGFTIVAGMPLFIGREAFKFARHFKTFR